MSVTKIELRVRTDGKYHDAAITVAISAAEWKEAEGRTDILVDHKLRVVMLEATKLLKELGVI